MTTFYKAAALAFALLALAGCGKKPSYHAAQQTAEPTSSAPAEQAQSTPAAAQSCSTALPDKVAIQKSLQKAMVAIYGIDEAPVKFQVVQTVAIDCEHATVRYRATGSATQAAPMAIGDGGKWFLTLYNKQYPVE